MKYCLIALSFLFLSNAAQAQEGKFSMSVSHDTLLIGHSFELTYKIENLNGQFEKPNLSAFLIVGGPNISTNMSSINGKMTQSQSYSYFLEAKDIGAYTILPAYIQMGKETLETEPIDIMVLPNPDGISQSAYQKKSKAFQQDIEIIQAPKQKKVDAKKKKRVRKIF